MYLWYKCLHCSSSRRRPTSGRDKKRVERARGVLQERSAQGWVRGETHAASGTAAESAAATDQHTSAVAAARHLTAVSINHHWWCIRVSAICIMHTYWPTDLDQFTLHSAATSSCTADTFLALQQWHNDLWPSQPKITATPGCLKASHARNLYFFWINTQKTYHIRQWWCVVSVTG